MSNTSNFNNYFAFSKSSISALREYFGPKLYNIIIRDTSIFSLIIGIYYYLQKFPLMANNKSSILQELTLHRNLLRDEIEKLDVRIIYLNNLKTSLKTSYKETSSAIASLEDS